MWILGQPHILTGRFCQDKYRLTGLVGYFYSKRFVWIGVCYRMLQNLLEIPPAKIDNLCATSVCYRFSQFIMRHIPGKEILIYYKEKNLERWPIFFFFKSCFKEEMCIQVRYCILVFRLKHFTDPIPTVVMIATTILWLLLCPSILFKNCPSWTIFLTTGSSIM